VGEGRIEVRARKEVEGKGSLSIDGCLIRQEGDYRLEALLVVGAASRLLARIRQSLSARETFEPTLVGGVPVPATFAISLRGGMAGEELPEAAGLLEIRPAEDKALPLSVYLATTHPSEAGGLMWSSPTPGPSRHQITVAEQKVSIAVEGRGDPTGPFWIAPRQNPILGLVQETFTVQTGQLSFAIQGAAVTGEIRAIGAGALFAFPDPGPALEYAARFSGELLTPFQQPSPRAEPSPLAALLRTGEAFEVVLSGSTEAGSFPELAGKLFLWNRKAGKMAVSVVATGPLQPGWLNCPAIEIDSAALARGEEASVALTVERPDPTLGIVWYTAGPEGPVWVAPRRFVLRLRLDESRTVRGEIEGEGVSFHHGPNLFPSSYRAALRGWVEQSPLPERLLAALRTAEVFAGAWILEDGGGRGARADRQPDDAPEHPRVHDSGLGDSPIL
jgi:hypothetical protein